MAATGFLEKVSQNGASNSRTASIDSQQFRQSGVKLLDAYAQRSICLGELIRRRREELQLTRDQVMDRSGYTLYTAHDLRQIEENGAGSVHEIWFTILHEPLLLDYDQFFDAYQRKRPRTVQVIRVPKSTTIGSDAKLIAELMQPAKTGGVSDKWRHDYARPWLSKLKLAKELGLTYQKTATLISRLMEVNPSLERLTRNTVGKKRPRTQYHVSLVRRCKMYLQLQTVLQSWTTDRELAIKYQTHPDTVDEIALQLVETNQQLTVYRFAGFSQKGNRRAYYHPGLVEMMREPLEKLEKEKKWISISRLAKEAKSSVGKVDAIARRLTSSPEYSAMWRAKSLRGGRKRIEFHPDLAACIREAINDEREARRDRIRLQIQEKEKLQAEKKERRAQDRAERSRRAEQQRQLSRETQRRRKEWVDCRQIAKLLGVEIDTVSRTAKKLMYGEQPPTLHELIEPLFDQAAIELLRQQIEAEQSET